MHQNSKIGAYIPGQGSHYMVENGTVELLWWGFLLVVTIGIGCTVWLQFMKVTNQQPDDTVYHNMCLSLYSDYWTSLFTTNGKRNKRKKTIGTSNKRTVIWPNYLNYHNYSVYFVTFVHNYFVCLFICFVCLFLLYYLLPSNNACPTTVTVRQSHDHISSSS